MKDLTLRPGIEAEQVAILQEELRDRDLALAIRHLVSSAVAFVLLRRGHRTLRRALAMALC